MLLKSLKISGFKSFARGITLEFPGGISAIVGPNGSGKSNVADAVVWVLGEQSLKNLRGKKGEDLIFNGSSSLGRLNKASASLNFLVEGGEEISVSRVVYRDGQNEYFINDSSMRLKDIIDCLSNIGGGVLRNHIVGQGESDRMINSSTKERRQIIEDALGLRVFQLKKEETQSKLAKTRENLFQVGSLRQEIQPHLDFLKKQTEKIQSSALRGEKNAMQKRQLEKECLLLIQKMKEVKLRIDKIGKIKFLTADDFVNFLKEEIDGALLEKDNGKIREILKKISGKIREKLETQKTENELGRLRNEWQSLSLKKERLELQIDRLDMKLEDGSSVNAELLKEYGEIKKRDDFLSFEIADLERTMGSLEELLKDLENNLEISFKSGIDKINREFQKFFGLMFPGGRTEIEAVRDGLNISVNFPKKKINSLSALSGGERTLTSVALLFAISQVNPPPFLVLDETDAALDESNSRKYAAMLKDLSKRTQLILITHNREIMSVADVLYGVTMSGDGVSKLLSLKFQDAECFVEPTS